MLMFKLALLPGAAIIATLSDTLSYGKTLIGVAVSIGAIITLLYGVKYRVVADQQGLTIDNLSADRDTWKDIAETRAHELEATHAEKQELLKHLSALKEEKARLEALPNLSLIIEQMSKEAERAREASQELFCGVVDRLASMMADFEVAAAARHADLIKVLKRPNGHLPPS